jgi:hypothetical protein
MSIIHLLANLKKLGVDIQLKHDKLKIHAPLLRACIIKKGGNHCSLVIDIHHITADGTSNNILEKEFVAQ